MNFCSNCGHPSPQFIIPDGDNRPRFVCANCDTIHYSNPRVIVGCLATYEGKILLCKRNIEPRFGLWNLPAGFLEEGETLAEGAKRETYEEALAEVEIIRPFAIFNLPTFSQVYVHYLAELKNGSIGITSESSEVELFEPNQIPFDEMAFHSSTFSLKKYLEFGPSHLTIHSGTHRHNSL